MVRRLPRHRSRQAAVAGMTVEVMTGDCLDVLAGMEPESVDSVVTDPPYHLTSIVKRFGSETAAPAKSNGATGVYARASAGFMGQTWDGGDVAFRPETWAAVLRVLKPGAHLLAFGGTRTYHRMVCAIEDAGFEIRDQIGWAYGQGFPKSHNLDGDWEGWGTALKPAWEPICLARKPLIVTVAANVLAHGTGALNIDGCRVETEDNLNGGAYCGGAKRREDASSYYTGTMAGEFAQPPGRWPANLIHDGSDEVLACFPETKSGTLTPDMNIKASTGWSGGSQADRVKQTFTANGGSAARFFYCAKASKAERGEGNDHPTVKPLALMRYLVRLITPPGGVVLDPFAGSGTTGLAAFREGFPAKLIEREPKYAAIIRARLYAEAPLFARAAE